MAVKDDPTASYKLVERELKKRGYTTSEAAYEGMTIFTAISPAGRHWLTRINHLAYPSISSFQNYVTNTKSLAYDIVAAAGVPTPFTRVVLPDESIAEHHAAELLATHGRLVVKPDDSSLSHGLTLNISTLQELEEAIAAARVFSKNGNVLIQQQVSGEEVRFVYVDGKIVAAMLRETPKVTGDGTATVAQLIEQENAARHEIKESMVPYPMLTPELVSRRIDWHRVPADGEVVELNRATMIGRGASVYNIIERIDPSYSELAKACGDAIGIGFAVVDMMIQNHDVPAAEGTVYFNEFNSSPVLKLFYSCRDGKHLDIVPRLVDALDKRIHL